MYILPVETMDNKLKDLTFDTVVSVRNVHVALFSQKYTSNPLFSLSINFDNMLSYTMINNKD